MCKQLFKAVSASHVLVNDSEFCSESAKIATTETYGKVSVMKSVTDLENWTIVFPGVAGSLSRVAM